MADKLDEASEHLNRLLALIPLIRQHEGIKVADLAQLLGRPQAEVEEDFTRILMCGTPPYYPDDYMGVFVEEGRVHISYADHFQRPVRLTVREAMALRIALEALPAGGRPAWQEARDSLIRKIDGLLQAEPDTRAKGPLPIEKVVRGQNDRLKMLQDFARNRQVVEVSYYSAQRDRLASFCVEPYGLVESLGHFYLVCRSVERDRVLTLRVDRLQQATPTGAKFRWPRGFDLDGYRTERMYHPTGDEVAVYIRFEPEVARWIREEFHYEDIEEQDDGGLILLLEVRPRSEWLINWVLQFGARAEILAPATFREMAQERLLAFQDRTGGA